jgi:cell division protein FtsL
VLLSIAVLLGGALLYLWPQMSLVELAYRQNALRVRRDSAARRRNELQVERATLRRLERIEAIAIRRLGMRPPDLAQVIYVKSELAAVKAGRIP